MREHIVDIWQMARTVPEVAICIPTNGYVKNNGRCVMSKGIAAQILTCNKDIDLELGKLINEKGNVVHLLPTTINKWNIISFPVKPIYERRNSEDSIQVISYLKNKFEHGSYVPGWACTARTSIIEKSCQELCLLVEQNPEWKLVLLPRPGCEAGELSWTNVKPILDGYFTDNKYVSCHI